MPRKDVYLNFRLIAGWLFICSFGYTAPAYAAPAEWTEFARALNNSMGGHQVFTRNTFIVLAIIIVVTIVLFIMNRIYWRNRKEEIAQYEKRRLEHIEQPARPKPSTSNQRRQWFRIKTNLLIKWIQSLRASTVKETQYNRDQLVDISGGGLSFTTHSALSPDDELNFQLDIGSKKPLNLKGKVLRVQDDGDTVQPTYFVAIQFSDLLSGERDRLVSWILKGQREELQEIKMEESAEPSA
ncbi:MAG: PilZ domain-containing protein [Syntrophomonas sp.]